MSVKAKTSRHTFPIIVSMDSDSAVVRDNIDAMEDREAAPRAKPPDKINIRDVAGEAGVSVATVSMVINNNPRISRATHGRVQRVIDRLGYRPSRPAQTLSGKYTQVIAVLLPALRHALADAYFGELLSGIADRAGKLGHKIIIEQAKPQYVKDGKHIELYERKFIDGYLCLGFNDKHKMLTDLATRQFPAIMVDNRFAGNQLDWIHCDYRLGAEQAMNCLLQLGHRKIALIFAAPESATARDVLEVYTRRMAEQGMDRVDAWMADGMFTPEGGAAAAEKLAGAHPDLSAILCGNDKMALGAMHYLAQKGISVPNDVSIIGFDDIQHLPFIHPSLTTVHLPLYELGTAAVDRLIEKVRGKAGSVTEVLPTHLILRGSTSIVRNR